METRTKIEVSLDNVDEIEVHYKKFRYGLWAIIYRENEPLLLAEYFIHGKELIAEEELISFPNIPEGEVFSIVEAGFETREEAEKRLKEIKNGK